MNESSLKFVELFLLKFFFQYLNCRIRVDQIGLEQVTVDRCTGWETRFLTLKNGDNYNEELKGKYVDIYLYKFPAMVKYYKTIGKKL